MREGGLEPPHLAVPAPKAGASTIPPLARIPDDYTLKNQKGGERIREL